MWSLTITFYNYNCISNQTIIHSINQFKRSKSQCVSKSSAAVVLQLCSKTSCDRLWGRTTNPLRTGSKRSRGETIELRNMSSQPFGFRFISHPPARWVSFLFTARLHGEGFLPHFVPRQNRSDSEVGVIGPSARGHPDTPHQPQVYIQSKAVGAVGAGGVEALKWGRFFL